ncbi:MAG: hypothetical protein K9M03_03080 [Kiritimatiellales bacterium]|nr:hypothetical protein [Kiritimatiellales bacterium]
MVDGEIAGWLDGPKEAADSLVACEPSNHLAIEPFVLSELFRQQISVLV